MTYSDDDGEVFLGHSVTQHKTVSDETAHLIDEEVREIVDRNYTRARDLLDAHVEKLHVMADALIRYETIDTEQINDIMAGKPPRPPQDWMDDDTDDAGGLGEKADPDPERPAGGGSDGTIGGPASLH